MRTETITDCGSELQRGEGDAVAAVAEVGVVTKAVKEAREVEAECESCDGTGMISEVGGERDCVCFDCEGTGKIFKTIFVDVPAQPQSSAKPARKPRKKKDAANPLDDLFGDAADASPTPVKPKATKPPKELKSAKPTRQPKSVTADPIPSRINAYDHLQLTPNSTPCIDQEHGKNWSMFRGDCCEVVKGLPDESIHFTVYSPPFASLYVYSNSERDLGNSATYEEFGQHYAFLIRELLRVTKPGRLASVHCMNLPTTISHHGQIGIQDFRGDIIREHVKAGWIYHSEVCIWKDPVTAMQRTKALGLLHKQIVKDSCMSRQGIPDYVCTFRKPGKNPEPVEGEFDRWIGDDSFENKGKLSIDVWQRFASPVWMDINPTRTLQYMQARHEDDERHICPLQLDCIERCVEMWSNRDDVILSPFGGIGSEGYVGVLNSRKFIGIELKDTYFAAACRNLRIAESEAKNRGRSLFDWSEEQAENQGAGSL